jgi:hypothetical protein
MLQSRFWKKPPAAAQNDKYQFLLAKKRKVLAG